LRVGYYTLSTASDANPRFRHSPVMDLIAHFSGGKPVDFAVEGDIPV
jgi:hypothetical protein